MEIDTLDITIRQSVKYIELITAIVALVYYKKYKGTFFIYFVLLLWLTVLVEFAGLFMRLSGYASNFIVFNVYHLINFTALLWLYKAFIKKKVSKRIISSFILFFILIYFLNLRVENYTTRLITWPFIVGSIFIMISVVFYFLEILNSDKVLYIKKNLLFWVSAGLLIYFAGKLPMRLVRNYWFEVLNYRVIFLTEAILSILMCGCFIIGFIWSEKRYLS